ncbi:helix-turn-helix transcriptional regulator [Methylobacterium nigriterrae]|uniref:helix-turn-helix transcriptional regulator n=1 Tax=Methylobacterium nigriterrae TaxID=3127512 RepID=UPI0030133504
MLIGMPLLQILDRMGCGGLLLATSGQVLAANDGARRIVGEMFRLSDERLGSVEAFGRELIKDLLSQGKTRIQLNCENWILIEREDRRPLIMNAVPVPALSEDGPHTVLMLIDLDATPLPRQAALERIFGLTPAEARLAVLLAGGATTAEAARMQGVSIATVRTQLGAIFAKTRTNRQADLVMLVTRLSALP